MRILFVIPARAGSKRLPGKNKKNLGGKPLICHTLEFALNVISANDTICLTSDDKEILDLGESYKGILLVDRPKELASDSASSLDVIMHAMNSAVEKKIQFDTIVLLQPTTPFRIKSDFDLMKSRFHHYKMNLYSSITTVKGNHKNKVYFNLTNHKFVINPGSKFGYLNGSIYFINKKYLLNNKKLNFEDSYFYLMSERNSIDIDTLSDWSLAEQLI